MKAEAFEEALARVSSRVATLARQAAARATKQSHGPGPKKAEPAAGRQGPPVTAEPTGDRALRSPRTEKQRAGTLAAGARQQAKRDSR